jgi:hypothetical protein
MDLAENSDSESQGIQNNMKIVQRSEIVDNITYEEDRELFQRKVFAAKVRRRIHLGDCFTFLFENALTIRYQVQEMMRAEKIVQDKDINHELDTYNGILGGDGELGCTFLIEIPDQRERDSKLSQWLALPEHIYAELQDGTKAYARFDPAQIGSGRLFSVQYFKFLVHDIAPVALGTDLPGFEAQILLTDDQRAALQEDLEGN